MPKVVLIRFFAAIATVVTMSGLAAFFISQVSEAAAKPASPPAVHQSFPKGDRVPFPAKGAACSIQGWPHYEQRCLFDQRRSGNEVHTVRVIAMR
jgi:hypothetical protein